MEKLPFGAFVNSFDIDPEWDTLHRESLAQFRNFMARPESEDVVASLMSSYMHKFGPPLDPQPKPVGGSNVVVDQTPRAMNLGFGSSPPDGYAFRSYGPPQTSQLERCKDCGRMRQKG